MNPDRTVRTARWSEADGVLLLRSVATAMVRLGEAGDPGTASAVPYPEEAQRALNATVLTCLLLKARPPESLPELVEWGGPPPPHNRSRINN
ncbi:pPIWI_RE_Y domain-containing protein [Streptomyces niveus]|uniref:pPIWI_RE_Y domain-containing protein n=1 Tax=Streptomyces niveus TaxID=193462 RepID=UPI0036A33752